MLYIPCGFQELCLHTKLLATPNTSIADFLSKAIEPPPFLVLRNAVALLKVCFILVLCVLVRLPNLTSC